MLTVKGSQLASITNTSTHASALHHPPPTPMLVSLHVRDGDIRQKSQSQLNNARSSSWPAHLHGDNWQRRHVFSERYVDVLLLFRSCFCTCPFSMAWNVFFGWQKTNGTLFVLKKFHNIEVGSQYLYAERIRCLSKSWSEVEHYCRHRDSIICFFWMNVWCIREKLNQRPECVMSSYEKQCPCYLISKAPRRWE